MKHWKKLSGEEIKQRIFTALTENINFFDQDIFGVPASHLDSKVFYQDAPFLKDAPYITTLVNNPNHIGCHTLGKSESFFGGTQQIEREVIEICAKDILRGEGEFDGYIASGGTEANIQAAWIYRNFFCDEFGAAPSEITILCSADSHYSMAKAANLLGIGIFTVPVNPKTRRMDPENLDQTITALKQAGYQYIIAVANMMTTMFGSVDHVNTLCDALENHSVPYKLHVDAAFGGFYYPFASDDRSATFENPKVNSVTLDAHKMVQAPYGTGIFLVRKGYMRYANTKEASYVEGEDCTLIGSRSGANAVAIWMILMTYGPFGWKEKIFVLNNRTEWLCEQLSRHAVAYFRFPESNIVTIEASSISDITAKKFGLVPDNHHHPRWYKIVVMEHVTIEKLQPLVKEITHPVLA